MKKGDFLIENKSKMICQIVGRWDKEMVLAPVSVEDEQVLIYTPSELDELIFTHRFNKLYNTGIKIEE